MINIAALKAGLAVVRSPILGAVLAVISLPIGYCSGERAGRAKVEAREAIRTVEVMKVDADAKEVAAIERRADDASAAELKQELTDAVADLPDALPSARRVALACERLRRQGTATADLPACR